MSEALRVDRRPAKFQWRASEFRGRRYCFCYAMRNQQFDVSAQRCIRRLAD